MLVLQGGGPVCTLHVPHRRNTGPAGSTQGRASKSPNAKHLARWLSTYEHGGGLYSILSKFGLRKDPNYTEFSIVLQKFVQISRASIYMNKSHTHTKHLVHMLNEISPHSIE